MKKRIFGVLFAVFMLTGSPNLFATGGCESGGVGSTSCTVTISYEPGNGGPTINKTATTTCGNGYYACCNTEHDLLHIKVSATCKKNPSPGFTDL